MEIEFALLAETAKEGKLGRVDIQGAGFNQIAAPGFPAVVEMTVVVCIRFEPNEVNTKHTIKLEFWDEQQGPIIGREGEFSINKTKSLPKRSETFTFAQGPLQAPFPRAGEYEFRITINDQITKILPIFAYQMNVVR